MDMQSIAAVLTSIKTATDIAKLITESDASLEKAESKLKFAELITTLANAKIQIADVQQLLIEKDTELRTIKEQLAIKQNIQWEDPYYWLLKDGKKDGPYCQCCYDRDHSLIRLQSRGIGYWKCKACRNSYTDKNYQPPRVESY